MDYVRVTNRSDKAIHGAYDGKPYSFPTGKPVDVPGMVATHIFGFRTGDKTTVLNRLGWVTTSDQMDAALERLNLIKIEDVKMVGQVVDDDEDLPAETSEMVPERTVAAVPHRTFDAVPNRTGAASPLDDAGGKTGSSLPADPNPNRFDPEEI